MSGQTTKHMIAAYIQTALPTMFYSGFFQSPQQNYHDSETVEIDLERMAEDVAIVITDMRTGHRLNSADLYKNKEFKPPVYKEAAPINAYNLIKRQVGQNPFQAPDVQGNAIMQAFKMFRKLEAKIRRAIELQASQVMQTGTLTLTDDAGNALYTVDFGPKASHFPTAGTAWGQAGATPVADLEALAVQIRTEGLVSPDLLIFGKDAFSAFIADEGVQNRLESRRGVLAELAPERRGQGGTFQGWIWIGNYRFEMWTYDGYYKHPQTGAATPYTDPGKVVMSSTQTRLDLTFGSIPMIVPPEQRVLPFLPPRISNTEGGMDLTTNAWVTEDGSDLMVSAGTRPMTIPTMIDGFGCLDTGL